MRNIPLVSSDPFLNGPINRADPSGLMLLDFILAVSGEYSGKVLEAASKLTYVQRLKAAVKNMEDLQMFFQGIDEANNNAFLDFITEMNDLQSLAADAIKGSRSVERHHLTPQAESLGKFFTDAQVDPHKLTMDIPKAQHDALHDRYFPGYDFRGGPWNAAWRQAKEMAQTDPRWKNRYFVAGFAAGLAKKVGLGVDGLIPY